MAFYNYECTTCGTYHEMIQFGMGEDHRPCPKCGSTKMVQDMSKKRISIVSDTTFKRYFSVSADRFIETRGEERAREKALAKKGWNVGPRRADDCPQSKADKKRAAEIAEHGPPAMEAHRIQSQQAAQKKKRREIDKTSVSLSNPPT